MRPLLIALFSLILFSCAENEQAVTILNADIITMDSQKPTAQAVAIIDNKIAAVGSLSSLNMEYPHAKQIDLKNKTILPGVLDSHTHIVYMGLEKIKVSLIGVLTVEEMIKRLKAYYPKPEPGQWLLGKGWDEAIWASNGYPTRQLLDQAFPDNPVHLDALHGFASFFNEKAFEVASIDKSINNDLFLRDANGELTGTVLDKGQDLVKTHIPPPTIEQLKTAILAGAHIMAKSGVTSIHEANMTRDTMNAMAELRAEGKLPIRIYGMIDAADKELTDQWLARGPLIDQDNFYTVKSIKYFYDGSLGSRTALMRENYSDDPLALAKLKKPDQAAFEKLVGKAADRGFQMIVHAIGDEGNDQVLDSFARVLDKHPGLDHRFRIEHAQVILPSFYKKAEKYNIIASMQPAHALDDSPWAEARLGPKRINYAYAWRSMLDHNIKLIFNSDLPAAIWRIQQIMYYAVNRSPLGGTPWYPEHTISIADTLKAMTITGAYAGFMEDKIGSIEVGKLADFTIFDQNPMTIEASRLNDINVVEVWVDGKKLEL